MYGKNAIAPNMAPTRKVESIMAALRYTHQSIGLSEESLAVPVSLLPGQESYNLDVLLELLISTSDEARVIQLNRHRLDTDSGTPSVLKALQQTRCSRLRGWSRWA
jgi:hypothetical protein